MVREAKKAKVHRQKQAKKVSKRVSLCLLPTCRKPFVEKKLSGRLGGRRREFCSPDCKNDFFQLARRIGADLLRANLAGSPPASGVEGRPADRPKEEAPTSTKEKNPAAVALGRLGGLKGGRARVEKLSPERRKEIARRAARVRWGKKDSY